MFDLRLLSALIMVIYILHRINQLAMQSDKEGHVKSLNIQILQKYTEEKKEESRYLSVEGQIFRGSILSLCAMMFGYGLTEISTIQISILVTNYHIAFSAPTAQAILIGIMPFGGIFGALLNKFFLQSFSRKNTLYFIAIFMIFSIILVQITTIETLIIGRFVQGICIGLYVSIGLIYLREITARQIKSQIMAMFSLGKVFGIVIAYSLQQVLKAANFQYAWRILLAFNGFLCIIQVILLYFFVPDSPVEMIQKSYLDRALKSIIYIYKKQYAEDVLQQLKLDYAAQQAGIKPQGYVAKPQGQVAKPQDQVRVLTSESVSYTENRKTAMIMAMHIIVLRQFCGGNCLVTFSGQIVDQFNKADGEYTPLVINLIQFVANVIAAFVVTKYFGKRPLLIFGTSCLLVANLIIALVLFFGQHIVTIVFMCVYMATYGISFLPTAWSYPSDILAPEQTLIPNVVGWIATTIVTTIPPIVVGAMPGHNAYPLFFFFSAYCIFGLVIIVWKMVESKGRTYEQIIKQY